MEWTKRAQSGHLACAEMRCLCRLSFEKLCWGVAALEDFSSTFSWSLWLVTTRFHHLFTRGSTSLAVHPDRHTEVTSDVFSKRDIETCAMRKRAQSAPVKHCWTRSAHEIRVSTAWPWAGHAERRYDHCFMPGIHDAREEENRRNVSYLFHSVCVCASWRMGSLWVREKQSITGCK